MPLFKSLEVLIGVSGIMLLLSMVVTMLTQIVIDVLRRRSIRLRKGVLEIIHEAVPTSSAQIARLSIDLKRVLCTASRQRLQEGEERSRRDYRLE